MIAHITIPVFYSPVNPIGASEGRISLIRAPKIGESLAWEELLADAGELIPKMNTGCVDYLDTSPQIRGVDMAIGLDGIYLGSEEEARELVHELQSRLGLIYVDY